ncbi:MAG: hypothetical protein WDN27_01770 [Candidatus Saccharibacteria bacterium]
MPTSYDQDSDEKHDLAHVKEAESRGGQDSFDREFNGIVANQDNTTEHPLGDKETGEKTDKLDNAEKLDKSEKDAGDDSMNYKPSNPKKKRYARWITKKKVAIAGGTTGGIVGLGLFGLTFVTGPLQFIHVAQILHNSHFSQSEDAGDGRMGKIIRYFRNGLDPGETRLGWIGSKYKNNILGQLKEIGITPNGTTTLGNFESMDIDAKNTKSPYAGLTDDEARAAIQTDYGGTVTGDVATGFKVEDVGKGYKAPANALKTSLAALKTNKLSTSMRFRVLKTYFNVSWHPLSILNNKVNKTASDIFNGYKQKWQNRIKNGTEPATGTATGATEEDEQGKSVPAGAADTDTAANAGKNSKQILESIKGSAGAKITGGVAAAVGLACALKSVDDNIAAIRYAQVIEPMIRVGVEAISVGDQIESGQDVDPAELSYLSTYFTSTDAATGQSNNWTDSEPIHADMGETGGIDINQGTKDTLAAGRPSWLAWTQNSAFDAACSTAGGIITGALSFGISVISGEAASAVIGGVIGYLAAPQLISYVSSLLSGDALDVAGLAGAQYGSVADYGATLAANAGSLAMGGVALTASQIAQLDEQSSQEEQVAFQSQSFLSRTFNLDDYQSLASTVLADQGSSFMTNVTNIGSGIGNVFSDALHLPFKLYATTVHADAPTYQYPFATYGFSQQDLDNPAVADPYANADAAAQILDSNGQGSTPDYIKKAADCFGVNITKQNSDGVWDVIPTNKTSSGKDLNPYDTSSYNSTECADTGDANWMKIRFFILDTGTMEGYACAEFNDATSCANDGEGSATPAATTTTTTATNGNATSLAQQVLANKNITLGPTAKADIQATANGQQVTPGPIEGQNNGSASTGPCAARTPVTLDPMLLQAMLDIANGYSYTIQDITSGHDCDTGRHPLGRAFDIFDVNGSPINGNCDDQEMRTFASYVTGIMSGLKPGATGGQRNGIGACDQAMVKSVPANINYFVDSSDQLHVDTGKP